MSMSSHITCTLLLSLITYSNSISCFGGKRLLKNAANFDTYDCPSFSLCFSHITFAKEADAVVSRGCTNSDQNVTEPITAKCALQSSSKNAGTEDRQCYCNTNFCNGALPTASHIFTAFMLSLSYFVLNATSL